MLLGHDFVDMESTLTRCLMWRNKSYSAEILTKTYRERTGWVYGFIL